MNKMKYLLLVLMLFVVPTMAFAKTEVPESSDQKYSVDTPKKKEKNPYWKTGIDISVQFMQNYVTDNWYSGGNSNLSLLGEVEAYFDYNNTETRFLWENEVELQYGFSTNFKEDKVGRALHMSNDITAYRTRIGYNLGKNWYVVANGDFSTTLFDSYKIDTNERTSGLFSPIRFFAGTGVEYKYAKPEKNVTVNVNIAPFTYKLVYVNDTTRWHGVDADGNVIMAEKNMSQYAGLKVDQQISNSYGSSFKIDYKQSFVNKRITLEAKLKFFTDYKGIETDLEVIADFELYKLLTARLSLHPRYDSTVEDGWDSKIQFKQFLSIGIVYKLDR